jgi:hypothetical protein
MRTSNYIRVGVAAVAAALAATYLAVESYLWIAGLYGSLSGAMTTGLWILGGLIWPVSVVGIAVGVLSVALRAVREPWRVLIRTLLAACGGYVVASRAISPHVNAALASACLIAWWIIVSAATQWLFVDRARPFGDAR